MGADDKENMGDAVWWKQLALARADVVIEMHRTHASGDWWDGWSEHGLRPVVTTVTRMDLLATAAGQVLLRDMSRPTRGGETTKREAALKGLHGVEAQTATLRRNTSDGCSMNTAMRMACVTDACRRHLHCGRRRRRTLGRKLRRRLESGGDAERRAAADDAQGRATHSSRRRAHAGRIRGRRARPAVPPRATWYVGARCCASAACSRNL